MRRVCRARAIVPARRDRPFYARQRGPYISEIISYSSARQSLRRNVLPLIARGNAYLAQGDAERALADYDRALKLRPGLPELLALKAEALVVLGRHPDALELLDQVLAARPRDAGALSTRGIVNMALGKIAEANADWRLQLDVARGRPAACACLALRLADYEAAIPHLEAASQVDPRDPYWKLYLNTARIRTGQPVVAGAPAQEGWPGALLGLQAGTVTGRCRTRPGRYDRASRGSLVPDGHPQVRHRPCRGALALAGSRGAGAARPHRVCCCAQRTRARILSSNVKPIVRRVR